MTNTYQAILRDNVGKIHLIVAATLAVLVTAAHAQSKVVQLHSNTPMRTNVNDNPFTALATAVTRDKKSPQFRVTWNGGLASAWDRGTMLYDRNRETLKYYAVGGQGNYYYQKHYLFKDIKDSTFTGLVKRYSDWENLQQLFPFSFLKTLPKLGYKKVKITDYSRNS